MKARIYKPAKSTMQSGKGKSVSWLLEFEKSRPNFVEPLMGWVGTDDTVQQVRLAFPTKEAAAAYARSIGVVAEIIEPKVSQQKIKPYADNFKYDRIQIKPQG